MAGFLPRQEHIQLCVPVCPFFLFHLFIIKKSKKEKIVEDYYISLIK